MVQAGLLYMCCGGASVYYSHTVGMLFFNYHKMVSRLLATCM